MQVNNYEVMTSRFEKFFNRLKPNDRLAIFTHASCTDGMISAIFAGEILKKINIKPAVLHFTHYKKEIFKEINETIRKNRANKVLILDTNVDTVDLDGFNEFANKNDFLYVDHHPCNPMLRDSEQIIKAESADCTSWLIYKLGANLFDRDKWTWLACAAMVSEFSYDKKENLDFLIKQYPALTKDKIMKSVPGKNSMKVGALIIYYNKNQHKIYSLLERGDLREMDKISREVADEVGKYVKKFKKEAEYYPKEKTYIYYYSPKFDVSSTITTTLSVKDPEKIFVSICNVDDKNAKCSMRHQAGFYDLNKIANESVRNLESGSGGGHRKASGARMLVKDTPEFKKRLLKAIREFKE